MAAWGIRVEHMGPSSPSSEQQLNAKRKRRSCYKSFTSEEQQRTGNKLICRKSLPMKRREVSGAAQEDPLWQSLDKEKLLDTHTPRNPLTVKNQHLGAGTPSAASRQAGGNSSPSLLSRVVKGNCSVFYSYL